MISAGSVVEYGRKTMGLIPISYALGEDGFVARGLAILTKPVQVQASPSRADLK